MPVVKIDIIKQPDPELGKKIGKVIYEAMTKVINVPANDNFQIITEHDKGHFIYDPSFLGIVRTDALIFIHITLMEGRSQDLKKALFKAIVDGLQAQVKARPEDVFIYLVETKKENWSFGNGLAQSAN